MKIYKIANRIISTSLNDNQNINSLKLGKLLYFIQAESLKRTGKPIFNDEIEAWDTGPVIRKIYARTSHDMRGNLKPNHFPQSNIQLTLDELEIVDYVVKSFEEYNDFGLVNLTTHQDPWLKNYRKGEFMNVIPLEDIDNFFNNRDNEMKEGD